MSDSKRKCILSEVSVKSRACHLPSKLFYPEKSVDVAHLKVLKWFPLNVQNQHHLGTFKYANLLFRGSEFRNGWRCVATGMGNNCCGRDI